APPAAADLPAAVAAHCREHTTADLTAALTAAGLPAAEVGTDLAALAADPRFARALTSDGSVFVRSPWEFFG
ncbi:hypothetical protein ACFPZ0_21755, partial [Streptomonospora nanhaiensis]